MFDALPGDPRQAAEQMVQRFAEAAGTEALQRASAHDAAGRTREAVVWRDILWHIDALADEAVEHVR